MGCCLCAVDALPLRLRLGGMGLAPTRYLGAVGWDGATAHALVCVSRAPPDPMCAVGGLRRGLHYIESARAERGYMTMNNDPAGAGATDSVLPGPKTASGEVDPHGSETARGAGTRLPADGSATQHLVLRVRLDASEVERLSVEAFELGAVAVEERDMTTMVGPERASSDDDPDPAVEPKASDVELLMSFADEQSFHEAVASWRGRFTLTQEVLTGTPWLETWREFFQPIQLRPDLWLVAPWARDAVPAGARAIVIEPEQAFGTGQHVSTRLALDALFSIELRGKSILDVGAGTGVLGLSALLQGAREVTFVDICPHARAACMRNATRNGLADRVRNPVHESLESCGGDFDVVVANIELLPLLDLAPALLQRVAPTGNVVLSGLLDEQVDEMQTALPRSLSRIRLSLDGWSAIIVLSAHSVESSTGEGSGVWGAMRDPAMLSRQP